MNLILPPTTFALSQRALTKPATQPTFSGISETGDTRELRIVPDSETHFKAGSNQLVLLMMEGRQTPIKITVEPGAKNTMVYIAGNSQDVRVQIEARNSMGLRVITDNGQRMDILSYGMGTILQDARDANEARGFMSESTADRISDALDHQSYQEVEIRDRQPRDIIITDGAEGLLDFSDGPVKDGTQVFDNWSQTVTTDRDTGKQSVIQVFGPPRKKK